MKAYINEKVISYKPATPDTTRFGGASNAQAESGIELRTIYEVSSVTAGSGNTFSIVGEDGDGTSVSVSVDADVYNIILIS